MLAILIAVVINVYYVSSDIPITLGYKPARPSFAGATGGTLGSYVGQLIPPGTPWPSKVEDYSTTPKVLPAQANPEYINKETTTSLVEIVTPPKLSIPNKSPFPARPEITNTQLKPDISDRNEEITPKPSDEVVPSKFSKPNRPPFLGPTGGNFIPQLIPPGEPWPASTVEINNTSLKPDLDNKNKETILKPCDEEASSSKLPVPNRPPFLGPTGGNFIPQIIPPGKPWPAVPKNPDNTPLKPDLVDRNKEITPSDEQHVSSQLPLPNRPQFLGPTGGNFNPQIIPPGVDNIVLKPDLVDGNKYTTLKPSDKEAVPSKLPVPNRPPFIGATGGNFIPQIIPPGKPWPARPEDYDGFSAISPKPNMSNKNQVTTMEKLIPSNLRPPFLGPTGGNFIPQIVPPGMPWPARPEDYEGFSVTSHKSILSDRYEETYAPSSVDDACKPENEEPYLDPTDGYFIPPVVPNADPLPAKPETDFTTSPIKPVSGDVDTELITEGLTSSPSTTDPDNINTEVITLFSLLSNNTARPTNQEPALNLREPEILTVLENEFHYPT